MSYFNIDEFQSKDGSEMPYEVKKNIRHLIKQLDVLREYLGKPIRINSGYRSVSHNKAIGGVPNSQHIVGSAADIHVSGLTPERVRDSIEYLINEGRMENGGLGVYDTFVHYNYGYRNNRWDNRSSVDSVSVVVDPSSSDATDSPSIGSMGSGLLLVIAVFLITFIQR